MGQSVARQTDKMGDVGITVIRPKFGERRVKVRKLFRTHIKVLREPVVFGKGTRDLHGDSLPHDEQIAAGAVLVPIWNGQSRPQDFVYWGIYDAIRGQEHTGDGYQAPEGEIASLRVSVAAAREAIKTFIMWGGLDRGGRRALNALLLEISEDHERARNPEKKGASQKFAQASEELDSRGRENPGARAARTVAGRDRLELRQGQVAAICQAIGPRRTALISELDRIWTDGWLRVWHELTDAAKALEAVCDGTAGNAPLRLIDNCLYAADQALESIDVEPFLSSRHVILSEINMARSNLARDRWNQARDEILRSLEGIQFKKAGLKLHEVLLGVSLCAAGGGDASPVPVGEVRKIRDQVGDFRERFARLSERRLKRPLKAEVEVLLGAAQEALVGKMTFAGLKQAAEYLKGALAYL